MKNYYRPAATVWARRKGLSFREWLKGWTMDDALLTVEYSSPLNPSDRAEDAAMWMWYMAARKAGDKLTFNADEIGSSKVWQRDAKAWYVELFLNNWRYTVLVTDEGREGFRVWPSKTERMD